MMYKFIIKEDCMKNEYVCELYPTKIGYDEESESEQEYWPDTYKIFEIKRPDCYYCNRCKDKIKKDRYQ